MDTEGLGGKFWLAFFGLTLAAGLAVLVAFLVFGAIWTTWGILAAFVAVGLVLIGVGLAYDRRGARR